jgi:hypothetical protein
MSDLISNKSNGRTRARIGLAITLLGFLIYLLGADPGLFNLDRSPIIGLIQILVFLFGLGIICVGGYLSLSSLWNGYRKTITADLGIRLVSTGYVISATSAMADIFGFGSHLPPLIPYLGAWQATGVVVGEVVIAFGFLMMIPFRSPEQQNA